MNWISIGVAMLAGAAIALQVGINGRLGKPLGSPFYAALASFTVGTGSLLAYCLLTGVARPTAEGVASAEWWAWTGGILGAVYVATSIALGPSLGATTWLALVVTGQMATAVILDHYGLAGLNVQLVTPTRLIGVALLVLGVVLATQR